MADREEGEMQYEELAGEAEADMPFDVAPEASSSYSSRRGPGEAAALAAGSAEEADAVIPDSDEYQLSHEFYRAYKVVDKVLKGDVEKPEQSDLEALASKLKAIAHHVVHLRLFSPNEELDDISTTDLKYLLVPYLLAKVVSATRDMNIRLTWLRQALIYWRAFAGDCQRLRVAPAEDFRAIDRSPEEFQALDPASKRDEKIDRYKRSKELDEKVTYLFGKKLEAFGDEFHWGAGGSFDEDMERELILALLARAVANTADDIASAEQELPLLEMMKAKGGPGRGKVRREPPPAEKPFIMRIQNKDELMQLYKEMVFQCPFEQPTITLAECADYEMAQVQERQARNTECERRAKAEEADRWWNGDRYGAQEDDEDEQKTYKDRDWDDWKDEHPYGSGNRMANLG